MNNTWDTDTMRRTAMRSAILSIGGVVIVIATLTYSFVQLQSLQQRTADMRGEIDSLNERRVDLDADIAAKTAELNKLNDESRLLQASLRELNATLRKQSNPGEARRATDAAILTAANAVQPRVIPTRVYIQVGSDSSRALANQITGALQTNGFIVPGVERVSDVPRGPELRYFRTADKAEADRAVALIGARVRGLKVVLVPGYENSTAIRPRHLELWM